MIRATLISKRWRLCIGSRGRGELTGAIGAMHLATSTRFRRSMEAAVMLSYAAGRSLPARARFRDRGAEPVLDLDAGASLKQQVSVEALRGVRGRQDRRWTCSPRCTASLVGNPATHEEFSTASSTWSSSGSFSENRSPPGSLSAHPNGRLP